jgi:uncharacterized protein
MTLDCQTCGACCFSTLASYVAVTGDDYERLAEAAESLTSFEQNRCYMRMHEGRCAALVIDAVHGGFACSIYALRPQVCRELERGSPACEAERSQKSARALRSLAVLSG